MEITHFYFCVFLFFRRRLWVCHARLRNMGEEIEDGSEVDKPVHKGKSVPVSKNHCFEV